MSSNILQRLKSSDLKTSSEQASFFQLCSTCLSICKQSVVLNDSTYFYYLSQEGSKATEGDPRFPLRLSISDGNQWNEEEQYIFETDLPHHPNGAALEASATDGCHLCSLFCNYLSIVRYGALEQEGNIEIKNKAEETSAEAQEAVRASEEQLYVRVGIDHNAVIVLYAGMHDNAFPELRSTLNVWPT
jgi:hypothetical protein